MASRKEQKEAARQRRLAEEQASAAKAARTRRLQMLGAVLAIAVIVVVVLVVVSSGGKSNDNHQVAAGSKGAKTTTATVDKLLKGIPQSGQTLGRPGAKVTVTEYGDLECPICREFALGAEDQLIDNDVRSGKVKLVYKSYPTATANGPNPSVFPIQQAAAYAAGAQDLGWNYIETFYREQGAEDTSYVNTAYLDKLARQIPGLNFAKWSSDRNDPKYASQVNAEENAANSLGINATPAIVVRGPKSQTKPAMNLLTYPQLEKMIQSVQ